MLLLLFFFFLFLFFFVFVLLNQVYFYKYAIFVTPIILKVWWGLVLLFCMFSLPPPQTQVQVNKHFIKTKKKKKKKGWHGYCYLNKVIQNCQMLSPEDSMWRGISFKWYLLQWRQQHQKFGGKGEQGGREHFREEVKKCMKHAKIGYFCHLYAEIVKFGLNSTWL